MIRQSISRHEPKRRVHTALGLFCLLSVLIPASPVAGAQEAATLERGKTIERELAGGQEHAYQLILAQGECASLIVEQRGIDVIVRLQGAQGNTVVGADDEYRSRGEERLDIVAEAAGSYRLSVEASSRSAPAGWYAVRLAEVRPATENDRLLFEAHKLKLDSDRAALAGEYENSRRFSERALAIGERVLGKEHSFVATLLVSLGNYYEDKYEFAKAISLFERALAISEKTLGAENPRTVDISRFLAYVYNQVNEVARAARMAERALEVARRVLGPEHRLVARCLHTLSQVRSDPREKEELLEKALRVAEETFGAEHNLVGLILNDLGILHTNKGNYERAEQYLLRANAINESSGGLENTAHVITLFNLGRVARERKDYAKAEDLYRRAIAIVDKAFGPDNPRLALILNNIANIYRARGDYTRSLEAHLRVLRISEATRGLYHPLTLISLGNIAKTYAAQGNIAEAIRFQSRVDAVIERNIEMNLAIGSERQKLSYLNAVAERTDRTISLNSDLAPGDVAASELAALVLLQRKGRVQDAMSQGFASLRQRVTPEEQALIERFNDTTSQLARLVLNGPQRTSSEEHQEQVRRLEEEKGRLEAEISRRSAEFRAAAQPVTLAAVQAAIPADAALVEFAVYRPFDPKAESNSEAYGGPRYIAYVLRQKGEVRWQVLGDAKTIDEDVGSLRRALRDPLRRDVKELARAVDEKVMKPVRALAGDASHLLISPDGELNLIPFEALTDEHGRYLVQRYSFTYLTSGRDLLRLQVARAAQNPSLIIADPLFGEPDMKQQASSGGAGARQRARRRESNTTAADLSSLYFAPLAGTASEARAIKSYFERASVLTGAQATETSLKQAAAPRLLHIATHGFFLTGGPAAAAAGVNVRSTRAISARARVDNPLLRSGLALAGANLRQGGDDDGILTALEAAGLNLWGTKLVVLSACDTGVGEIKNGEGVYGLRRAFLLAGTETLVMSLWPVSDYVTRELMTAYYRNLKQRLGRGEALRQVQLSMLKRKGREHPFYWASFIQSGEWAGLDGSH